MPTLTPDALKASHRDIWAEGSYEDVATLIEAVGPNHLLPAAGVSPDDVVLDVATGTGNVALAAAATGAQVIGLDLTPSLLAVAAARAAVAELAVGWVEGDAEALPFPDDMFDQVLSVFGSQFAPRHSRTTDEMLRVCRPGGTICLVNWTPTGLIGRMFAVMARYSPAPPPYATAPALWGNPHHVRALFGGRAEIEFEGGCVTFEFDSIDDFMEFFEEHYGPTIATKRRLENDGTWRSCRRELRALYDAINSADDGTARLAAEYLVVIARKL
jgi:SAM-dependent methyltransferase